MCGEKHRSVGLPKSRVGSPPRMRGKRSAKPLHSYNSWDHPRVCGEKGDGSSAAAAEPGSPPRMRGKVLLSPFFQPMPGITPAYAGKRVFASTHLCNSRDHPRMCGEKKNCLERGGEKAGSPPHVRGKGGLGQNARFKARITPAYAGKRHSPCMRGTCPRDHPRVCGEKLQAAEGFRL